MSSFELSQYQKDILNFVKNNNSNLLVDAKAGSGKTSTLIEINKVLFETGKKCLVLSFTRSIVKELEEKFDSPNCMVKTIYGLGLSFIKSYLFRKHGKNYQLDIDEYKIHDLCNSYYEKYLMAKVNEAKKFTDSKEEKSYHKQLVSEFTNLCNMVRVYNLNLQDNDLETSTDNDRFFRNKIIKRFCTTIFEVLDDILTLEDCRTLVSKVVNAGFIIFENPTLDANGMYNYKIDFIDMIALPVHYRMSTPKSFAEYTDTVLVDECIPAYHYIDTNKGKISFRELKRRFLNEERILVKSFNDDTKLFEYKDILDIVDKGERDIYEITVFISGSRDRRGNLPTAQIQATANHKFLTKSGWKYVSDIGVSDEMVTTDEITDKVYYRKIKSIEYKGVAEVMDMEVADNHNFIVSKYFRDIEQSSFIAHNCQDLSSLQQQFVKLMSNGSNRFIFVGDKFQGIYGFNGADAYSIENIKKVFHTQMLPLNICYRCPENVIRLARSIVPDIEWNSARNDIGEVGFISLSDALKKMSANDVCMARYNKDLVGIYKYSLLDLGIPVRFRQDKLIKTIVKEIRDCVNKYINFYNKGLNIDKEMYSHLKHFKTVTNCIESDVIYRNEVNLILPTLVQNRLGTHTEICKSNYNISYLEACIAEYMEYGEYKFDSDEKDLELAGYTPIILELIQQYKDSCSSVLVEDFIDYVKQFLSRTQYSDVPQICTVHAMKGGEADNIYIYNYPMFPYKFSSQSPEDAQQELNIQYVALTRAKKNIYLILIPKSVKGGQAKNTDSIIEVSSLAKSVKTLS